MTQPWTPPTASDTSADTSSWGPPREPEPQWGPPAPAKSPSSGRVKWIGVIVGPLVAVVTFVVLRNLGDAPKPAPVDVEQRMMIAAPYIVGQTDANVERLIREGIAQQGAEGEIRDVGAHEILRGGELVGWLVILDAGFTDKGAAEYLRGFEASAPQQGGTTERRTIRGRETSFLSVPSATSVTWVEPPIAYVIVALDVVQAERLADAVLEAALVPGAS
jgi:hypothetical protein